MVVFVPQGSAAISVQLTPRASSVLTSPGKSSHMGRQREDQPTLPQIDRAELKPHLGSQPQLYSQALTAAVRDGHLAMTRWLFANGDADPNAEDALGKRPLTTALEKGFQEVAQELRSHGARESD